MTRNIPILVHTDAAQTIGKLDVNVDDLQVFIFITATLTTTPSCYFIAWVPSFRLNYIKPS